MDDTTTVEDHPVAIRNRADELAAHYDSYDSLADAIDAFAQEQIEAANGDFTEAVAKERSGTLSETEKLEAVKQETAARQEVALALQNLLRAYDHDLHRGYGVKPDQSDN